MSSFWEGDEFPVPGCMKISYRDAAEGIKISVRGLKTEDILIKFCDPFSGNGLH